MQNPKTHFLLCSCIMMFAMIGTVEAQEGDEPFVVRTFAYFPQTNNLAPDYFLSDTSRAVTVLPGGGGSDFTFAPCETINGPLAGAVFVTTPVHHATKGNTTGLGSYAWLLTEDTPDLPPVGATTLTGVGSPFVLSQRVLRVTPWTSLSGCPGVPGDLIVSQVGIEVVIVTAVFNR